MAWAVGEKMEEEEEAEEEEESQFGEKKFMVPDVAIPKCEREALELPFSAKRMPCVLLLPLVLFWLSPPCLVQTFQVRHLRWVGIVSPKGAPPPPGR